MWSIEDQYFTEGIVSVGWWEERMKWKGKIEWIIQLQLRIGNNITDEGARSICEALRINSSLKELYLIGDNKKWNGRINRNRIWIMHR